MKNEPIRIPATLFAILVVVAPVAIAWLNYQDVRTALATALASLVAGGGIVATAEGVRAFTDSPATRAKDTWTDCGPPERLAQHMIDGLD